MQKLPENYNYRKKTAIIMAAVLFILHLMYIPSMTVYTYIDGDIAYKGIMPVLGAVLTVISVITKYFLFGVILTVYVSYTARQSRPYTIIAAISLLITRIAEVVYYVVGEGPITIEEAKQFIYTTLFSFAIDIAVLLILWLVAVSITPKKLSVYAVLVIIVCAVPLVTDLFNEFLLFRMILNENSAQDITMTGKEVLTAVWGFAQHIVKAIAGFFILVFVNKAMYALGRPKQKKDAENGTK